MEEVTQNANAQEVSVEEQKTADSAKDSQSGDTTEKQEEKTDTPENKIAELEAKLAESHDQFLRKAAEFENFRKRMNQEKANAIEYANQALLLDLIPVIDDFERAIIAGETTGENASFDDSFLEGIKMIEKRLTATLESKWGLKRYNSVGEPFDPNLHEALYMEKSPDVKEAVVQEDLFKGYYLKDRVIRAAKVKVLMPENSEQVAGNR